MLPQKFMLKDKIKLYDNIAAFKGHDGRLHAELHVYPTPRIVWEFEMLDQGQDGLRVDLDQNNLDPIIGTWFSIQKPVIAATSNTLGLRHAVAGFTARADYGDPGASAHTFRFFLPNARFQFENLVGQQSLERTVKIHGEQEAIEQGDDGRSIKVSLDNTWQLSLETRRNAFEWIDPQKNNTGTLITTAGHIYSRAPDGNSPEDIARKPTLALNDVIDLFTTITPLCAFANGGYLGPLYVEGFDLAHFEPSSAAVLSYRTTPLEQLGMTWLARDSSLGTYLQCFSALHRMLERAPWDEALPLILAWYFQTIQPSDGQGLGKEWPIVANAAGTALERLSYTVLVLEENDAIKRSAHDLLFDITRVGDAKRHWNLGKGPGQENFSVTGKRLYLLLERIGLTQARGYDEADDTRAFLELRNEATHPKPGLAVAIAERDRLLNKSIQWIEEVLLWRLGYNSRHLDRSHVWRTSRDPRYDLSTRDPNW